MESLSKHFDEFTKVNTLVGYIIKNSFISIALVFHVANFHLQFEILGYLARTNHRFVLACLCFLILVEVDLTSLTIDASDGSAWLERTFLHLKNNQLSCESHHTYIMTWLCFHCYDIPLLKVKVIIISIVALTGVFELYFHIVGNILITGHVGQVVVDIELMVAASTPFMSNAAQRSISPHTETAIVATTILRATAF